MLFKIARIIFIGRGGFDFRTNGVATKINSASVVKQKRSLRIPWYVLGFFADLYLEQLRCIAKLVE